jgi:predicted regulator of Ras-like GTPase activity (Roadblock/LC7/MglB family)/predicted Zn-dependent protease
VTDNIRSLTTRLAEEPSSLAFLELGEALRQRGQLEAAYKVARGGQNRYPGLADAHDLVARILSDQGDLAGSFDAWSDTLRLDPLRTSALKGIAFLYFRAGDVLAAVEHLERAAESDPDDESVPRALARIRSEARRSASVPRPPAPSEMPQPQSADAPEEPTNGAGSESPFGALEEGEHGLLLVDTNGLRLGGKLTTSAEGEMGDRVAAQLAGLSREAARATRLLGLGTWHSISVETPDGQLVLSAPTAETVLLAVRDRSLPMARVGLLAERAARAARTWLEREA